MKTTARNIVLLIALLVGALASPAAATWEHYPALDLIDDVSAQVECLRVSTPPTPDAIGDEEAWQRVRPLEAWVCPEQHCNRTALLPFTVRFLYDDSNIYVFFETAAPPPGADLPEASGWRLHLTMDPVPDHINTPYVEFRANGSAIANLTSYKNLYREDQYKELAQPTGKVETAADGRWRGEFVVPIAGLMADPPAPGDAWDLDAWLRGKPSIPLARWGTDFIPGRLRFVTEATPAPAYRLTAAELPVSPHHGKFLARVTVTRDADGPPPTEITAQALTGRQRGSVTSSNFSPDMLDRPIALAVEMPEPGMGAVRFQLRRADQVTDTLVVPVEIDPDLPRFADTPAGSFDCYVRTLTVRPDDRLEGHFGFCPAQETTSARVLYRIEPIETVGSYVSAMVMESADVGGDSPLTAPFSLDVSGLPCGRYRLSGAVEAGGSTQTFQSESFVLAGNFMTDYEGLMSGWQRRVDALADRKLAFPFQRDHAEFLLYMLGRHGPEKLQKASVYTVSRRAWWPLNWAVQLNGMLDALEADRDYYAGRSGIFLCAYRSKVDGMLQPYELTLPEGFDKTKKWPTLFTIHGTSSSYYYSLIAIIELGYQPVTKWPMMCVGLDGRAGPTQHGWLADVDFLEVREQLKQQFGLDTQRVFMSGYSRGGRAAWYYAVQMPHLFAGAAPCAPFGYMHAGELPNVKHMLVNSYHGVHDPRTATGNGPVMIGALNELGGNGYHMEIRVAGHDLRPGYRSSQFMESLLAARAPEYPKEVEFICTRPRYSRAYWVTIDRLIRYGRPGHVKVRATGGRTIRIDTENVGALSLDLSGDVVEKGKPLRIMVNRQEREMDYAGNLRIEIAPADGSLLKSSALSGPIGDWVFGKSLIVYGTEGSADIAQAYKALADKVKMGVPRNKRWLYIHDVESDFPVKADTAVTAEDIADCNLVLLGGPGANLVTSRIAEKLPIKFAADGISLGHTQLKGPNAEVIFVHPNPENLQRYVVVVGSADPAHKPATKAASLRSIYGDITVTGGEPDKRLPSRLHFDAQWRFQEPQEICQVPPATEINWHEFAIRAIHAQTGADIAFRFYYGKPKPLGAGPLYYADVVSGVRDEAIIEMTMTGAEFTDYLRNWIALYGKPPLLEGMELDYSFDPDNKLVRINSTGLAADRKYKIVTDEVSATRPCWAVPEHVTYRLLADSVVAAAVKHLQEGNLPPPNK